MRSRRLLLIASVMATAGCSTYAPVDRATLSPGDAIRVELTPEESANQAPTLGAFRDDLVGTIHSLNDASLGLTISAAQAAGSPLNTSFRSFIEVPWDGVSGVARREFSWVRTGLAAAGAAAVAVLILELANPSGGGGEEPPPTNQGLISIPLGG